MNRVFRYRLYPTVKQTHALNDMLRDHCDLYNAALQERRDAWRKRGISCQQTAVMGKNSSVSNVGTRRMRILMPRVTFFGSG